ncbi:hypothetical protein [Saccharothrix obliqua]|uniref:hypothetical protein n=1 Tax=Saccharothrix obliqua TaxID=2861747 RepID=UPI001C5D056A|nr:hypothetical protein [Saccharothrix obliqua]MBW4717117.1 hypothetical protein [Saccharothrix obliqua]
MIRRIAWPLAPVTALLPAGLVLAVTAGMSVEHFGRRPEWPATSALAHEHLALVGPLVAAIAFHRWATLARPLGLFAAARLGGTGKPEHWANFTRVWAVCAVAYTVGLLPIFARTAADATYGGPAAGSILLGYLGLAFAVAIGQFLAAVAPLPVLTVLVAVLVFLLFQLPQVVLDAFGAVLPVQWHPLAANEHETATALLFRAFALIAIGGAMVLASRLGRSPDRPARTALPALGAVAVLAVFLVVAAVNPATRVTAAADPPRRCQPVEGVEVCVHPAHDADLPDLTATVAALVRAYGRTPAAVAGVHDAASLPPGEVPAGRVVVRLLLDQTTRDTAGEDVSTAMAGFAGCLRGIRVTGDRATYEAGIARAGELARWLRHQAGITLPSEAPYQPPTTGFFAKPPDEIRAWLAANDDNVAQCRYGAEFA